MPVGDRPAENCRSLWQLVADCSLDPSASLAASPDDGACMRKIVVPDAGKARRSRSGRWPTANDDFQVIEREAQHLGLR